MSDSLVLDKTRYQRNAVVQAMAPQLGISPCPRDWNRIQSAASWVIEIGFVRATQFARVRDQVDASIGFTTILIWLRGTVPNWAVRARSSWIVQSRCTRANPKS